MQTYIVKSTEFHFLALSKQKLICLAELHFTFEALENTLGLDLIR